MSRFYKNCSKKLALFIFFHFFRLQVFEGKNLYFDTGCLFDKTIKGGKVGLFVFSQKNVIWSDIKVKCEGELFSLVFAFWHFSFLQVDALMMPKEVEINSSSIVSSKWHQGLGVSSMEMRYSKLANGN